MPRTVRISLRSKGSSTFDRNRLKQREQQELLRRQLKTLPAPAGVMPDHIDLEVGDAENVRVPVRSAA
jgi:hypothetical protein